MLASNIDELIDAARALAEPVYMTEQAEITDYYQDTYGTDWRGAIVADMTELVADLGRPMSHANVARRFQGGRIYGSTRPTARSRAEYRELGQRLPPKFYNPPTGYQIDFDGYVLISEECERRSFSEQLTGSSAYDFANSPSFGAAMDAYFPPGLVDTDCGPWEMSITALGEDEIEEPSSSDEDLDEGEDIEWDT